jgi:S-adenosylmethionine synthetase
MSGIIIEEAKQTPVEEQRMEFVERKGIGHPDSICDAIMENVSIALCSEYLAAFGRILHYNVDKGLLIAGRTKPRLGGGNVVEPMRFVFGDRATAEYRGRRIDPGAIAEASAKKWIQRSLRFVDAERHVVFQSELKQGSPELTDLFERETIGANDTSVAVGYAPLTETEELVLASERHLNSSEFKVRFPAAGEDIKVMGYRVDRELRLTIALAVVDRFVSDCQRYFELKHEIETALSGYLVSRQRMLDRITIEINTLDDSGRGEDGIYLTVLGTSAEGGDCGEVGRGNRVNGLAASNRPLGLEAAAGKNPVSHVGKIYTLLTHKIAAKIHADVPGIHEVYVWLGSQIGKPIDQPQVAYARLILQRDVALADVQLAVEAVIEGELATIGGFTEQLVRGEWPVC